MKKLIVIFISFVFLFSACSASDLSKFLKEIDSGNYLEATSIYDEKIYGNTEKELEAYNELESRLGNVFDDYNNSKIDYNKAKSIISTIEKVNILDPYQIQIVYDLINELNVSKTNFESAEELFNQGYYKDAYLLYCEVLHTDTNKTKAEEKTIEVADIIVNETLDEVLSYENSNDYIGAMNIIDNTCYLIGNDPYLYSKYNELSAKYIEFSISEAEKTFNTGKNYNGAISIITAAIDNIGEDSRLVSELEKYKAYIPVYINEMDYIDKYGSIKNENEPKDNYGNIYKYGLRVGGYGNDTYYVTYHLGQNYTTFSGTSILPYKYRNTTANKHFEIYGDSKLIFKSNSMTSMSNPQNFVLDVSNVTNLTIKFPMNDSLSVVLLCDGLLEK